MSPRHVSPDLRSGPEQAPDIGGAIAVSEDAVVAHAVLAFGQGVAQGPADELVGRQGHGGVPTGVSDTVVLDAEGDAPVADPSPSAARDRHTAGTARHGPGPGDGFLGTTHSALRSGCRKARKAAGSTSSASSLKTRSFPALCSLAKPSRMRRRFGRDSTRMERKTVLRRAFHSVPPAESLPPGTILCPSGWWAVTPEACLWHDARSVPVARRQKRACGTAPEACLWHGARSVPVARRRAPGMMHGCGTDLGAKVLGVGSDPDHRVGARPLREVADLERSPASVGPLAFHWLTLVRDIGDRFGQREDEEEIPPRQRFGLARSPPGLGGTRVGICGQCRLPQEL